LKGPPTVFRNNDSLFAHYQQLKKGDIICGRIRLHHGEEHLLTDLLERGIYLLPSATAQLASRSKVFQTKIFSDFMLPGTLAIYDTHDILQASTLYNKLELKRVVLKCDRKNGGLGVHLFNNMEDLYNHVGRGSFYFPFVVQPFQQENRDIRVIILQDYIEAYERNNDYNFRSNLHCGGKSTAFNLSAQQISFCQAVMQRGHFPYAHLDLMLLPDNSYRLTEINLRGGLKGAQISGKVYQEKTEKILNDLLIEYSSTN
jgi:ribosomal protein S6--L-glutamate ligase